MVVNGTEVAEISANDIEVLKLACFTDFDGTVTDEDSNDYLIDNHGMGRPARRELLQKVLRGELPFREAFQQMISSVAQRQSFEQCCTLVANAKIKLDPGFKAFYHILKEKEIPLVIVSSGMIPIIRSIVGSEIGEDEAANLTIIANDVEFFDANGSSGQWGVKFRHPHSPYGHDKDVAISAFRSDNPEKAVIFCGDGLSDMSAARSATLFVKMREGSGDDLAAHCEKENIPFEGFRSFYEVKNCVEALLQGRLQINELDSGRAGRKYVTN